MRATTNTRQWVQAADEREMIELLRGLAGEDRVAVVSLLRSLAGMRQESVH